MADASAPLSQSGELDAFLAARPETTHIDALFFDVNGQARGKRFPRDEAGKIWGSGMQVPAMVPYLDVTGDCLNPDGRGIDDGDPDATFWPVPGTLVPVPWAEAPSAQVLMTYPADLVPQTDSRRVLAAVAARFGELGLTPVAALELEFFLIDRERDAEGRPQPPILPRTGRHADTIQCYAIDEIDAFGEFIAAVDAAAQAQGIPATNACTEYAPGQFEINLRHTADPVAAADHASLLRRLIKGVARVQGMDATFLSKPFLDQVGNGLHVHLSLVDRAGRNVFDDGGQGSAELRFAVGGVLATMAEAMAIFAPHLNAFRRFGPNRFVPVTRSWGINNRSVAVRIPSGEGPARRFEHRVAGADANTYLTLAAILAGVHWGLTRRLDPGPPSTDNAGEAADPDLPLDLPAALDALADASILPEYLTPEVIALYVDAKRLEHRKFLSHISRREYDWYL